MPKAANHIDEPLGEESRKTRWPMWKLVLMALPQLGVQVLWQFIGPNSADYMRYLGLPPYLATLNNVAGPITGFFTGPLVGSISDTCTSRLGRRRPVIIGGLISTWVAGILFASSEHLFTGSFKIAFAAPMYWVLDVTINILQTPNRALVADLAAEDQQTPMQVVFVFMMAIGNFLAFSIMGIYKMTIKHMLELMLIILAINTVCVGIQFMVAKEVPLTRRSSDKSLCSPFKEIARSVSGMPRLLYQLAMVQCWVWVGNTAWNIYSKQWFTSSVWHGNPKAPEGSTSREAYAAGAEAFKTAGQYKSVLQLVSSLLIIGLLLKTRLRPRLVYAPCIFLGAVVDFLAAYVVGTSGVFAMVCFIISVMPETGSFAIPFGLVATLNKRAEEEGKPVSTALQMALLNCCVTVGQQVCTMSLAFIETCMTMEAALPIIFLIGGVAHGLGAFGALLLDDRGESDNASSDSSSEDDSSSE